MVTGRLAVHFSRHGPWIHRTLLYRCLCFSVGQPCCGGWQLSSPLEMWLPQPLGAWRGSDLCVFSGLRPSDLEEGRSGAVWAPCHPCTIHLCQGVRDARLWCPRWEPCRWNRGQGAPEGAAGQTKQRLLPLFSVTAIHPRRSFSPWKTAVDAAKLL